ncbi:MAG TPA: hypothetical protein VKM93_27070 [Terriglobia bacterium]|nr:hypothetical protein [Terriglobia bacterium]
MLAHNSQIRKRRAGLTVRMLRGIGLLAAVLFLAVPRTTVSAPAHPAHGAHPQVPDSGCNLGNGIEHVIYVIYDNIHFERDNPNVPSDLEQMPHLYNFIKNNGTLLSNNHTPLISHTGDDIITSLTGVYGSHHGQPVANSFDYYVPSTLKTRFTSTFEYWTDIVDAKNDPTYYMITANGQNAPAPWVPYTRAGCNVGAVSIANLEFENITTDINNVYGPNSPEAQEAKSNRTKAAADFEGIAVHCAQNNPVCAAANHGEPDVLPQEPGGYNGFNGLFGHKYVAPVISPGGPIEDVFGNVITDGNGNDGFPGFGPISTAQTLGYVAQMVESGVPVVFAYSSDAHDDHVTNAASGPGQADYEAQLQSYDLAWKDFFTRLQNDGITPANTLFVFSSDEQDHFCGGPPSPANCDGVNVTCTYSKIGEVDANMAALLDAQDSNLSNDGFDIHFDMAPVFYVYGNPTVGSPLAREFERAASQLTAVNPITGNTDQLTVALADPVELKLLHMLTGDPLRNPTFVMFANPDWYFQLSGPIAEGPGFAWNHGGVAPEINTTWVGFVGPGVANRSVDSATWADHTDVRPTMLVLAGLQDDYQHDGRALVEDLNNSTLPAPLQSSGPLSSGAAFRLLANYYKQINAPLGPLGMSTLASSTTAVASNDPNDATYNRIETAISNLTTQRDALAAQMLSIIEAAEFSGKPVNPATAAQLAFDAEALIHQAKNIH